ncbi:MAG: efflux RND transporter periplasmic adaptor subunit [Cytophagales bacterium]|nr:efflux RND transporter periplasmic adaptor subunit [Cytophagales bacterium]
MAKKKKSSNRIIYILLGVVALLLVFAAVGKNQGWVGGEPSTKVEIAVAEKATIIEKVSASGTVQPVIEVNITPEVSGEIIELYVEEGDSVREGQDLLKINPDNFIAGVERARANLNQQLANQADSKARLARAKASQRRSEQEFNRQKKLFGEKVISEADYQLAEANYEIAVQDLESAKTSVEAAGFIVASSRATLDEAQENLRRTSITAPMTGIVSKLNVEKGETVLGTSQFQGTEILRIADLSNMEVRVDVNENDIIKLAIGNETVIDVDSYSYQDKEFKGTVTQIANTANDKVSADAVTEFEVRMKILNSSYADLVTEGNKYPFRPGMTASVDIITTTKKDILTVPLSAVTTRVIGEDNEYGEDGEEEDDETTLADNKEAEEVVFVFRDGEARRTLVTTGISDFDRIEIIDGISDGDQVISGPFLAVSKRLKDGEAVEDQDAGEDDDEEEDSEE